MALIPCTDYAIGVTNQRLYRQTNKDLNVINVNTSNEYAQLVEKIKSLTSEKKTYRSKAIYNWKERKKLELLYKKVKQERDAVNALLADAKQTLQEFQEELQRKNRSREEAWKKASESSAELEVLKQQFNTLKSQFQQKTTYLQMNSNAMTANEREEENTKLRKALDATLRKVNNKDTSIRRLKNQKKVLLKEKKHLKNKIYQQAKLHQVLEAKHKINLTSERKKNDSLVHENRKLRRFQLKAIRKLKTENKSDVNQFGKTINSNKIELNKINKEAKNTDTPQPKRQTQESVLATLSDDLYTLNKEKALLTQNRDKLLFRELHEFKNQQFDAPNTQKPFHKKAGLSLKMLQL